MPAKTVVMGLLISPMVVPLIISAAGMFFFYTDIGLASTHLGAIFAHTALSAPFVVITVTATLVGFDESLIRAAAMPGASPFTTFRRVIMPLILPGVISGAICEPRQRVPSCPPAAPPHPLDRSVHPTPIVVPTTPRAYNSPADGRTP